MSWDPMLTAIISAYVQPLAVLVVILVAARMIAEI